MLGWFKKKFARKKREEAETPVEAEQVTEAAPDAEGEAAVPETAGPEAAAAGAVEGGKEALRPAPEAEASEPAAGPEPVPAAGPPPEPEPAAEVAPPEVEEELEADAITEVPEEEELGPQEPSVQEAGSADADAAVAAERAEPEQRTVDVGRDKPRSMFRRLQERLGKTRDSLVHRLDSLFLGKKEIDEQLLDDLEEILITADLGVGTTMELLDAARRSVRRKELSDPQALRKVLQDRILAFLQESDQPAELVMPEEGPFVIMVVGVNGVGKTTSIGKIAAKFVRSGQSVLLVAGDTFRAAAIDQLRIWGDRVGVEVVAGEQGADPSSVVFDGVARAVADNYDVVLIDTAGRLHTSVNLMEELKKIRRVIGKKLAGAPHEVMLVLDATTGQNGISQAKLFHEAVGVTGLTLTKLDGTAKGGIVVNVCRELGIPVRFIGIGEHVDDLRDFSPEEFVDALFARADGERDS